MSCLEKWQLPCHFFVSKVNYWDGNTLLLDTTEHSSVEESKTSLFSLKSAVYVLLWKIDKIRGITYLTEFLT